MTADIWALAGIALGGALLIWSAWQWLMRHVARQHEQERLQAMEAAAVRERRENERCAISDARWRKLWIVDDPDRWTE